MIARICLGWVVFAALACVGLRAAEAAAPAAYATLDEAVARGAVADVTRLLDADPAALDRPGASKLAPLHQAILRKKTAIALILIERGADVNAAAD